MMPGRGRGHEALGKFSGGRLVEHVALSAHAAQVLVAQRTDRLRRVEDLGSAEHPALAHDFDVLGKFAHVPRRRAAAFAAETLHPLRHIGLKPDPRLLAVVADIDACGELTLDHVRDGGFGLAIKQLFVDRLATLLLEQQFGQFWIARQTSDMGGEDAFFAFQHGERPLP